MKNAFKFLLSTYWIYIVLSGLVFLGALAPYYFDGTIILGGEGDYAINFIAHLKKFGFLWFPSYGLGIANLAPCGTGLNILSLALIEKITGSVALTNFTLIFSIYFLPFLSMFFLARILGLRPVQTFLLAFFYVVNPFILYYLTCLNQWNVFSISALPIFLYLIIRFYFKSLSLFFIFLAVSMALSFAYTNAPMLVVIHISLVLGVFFAGYFHTGGFSFIEALKKYCLIFLSFVLANLWWILPMFIGAGVSTGKKLYAADFARSWLETTVKGHGAIIPKMLALTTIIPPDPKPSYDFFTFWYNSLLSKFVTLIPFGIIFYFIFIAKHTKKKENKFLIYVFLVMFLFLFLAKGVSGVLGNIYGFLFVHLPMFYIFKSPVEKFGLLFVFIFTILLGLVLKYFEGAKHYKISLKLLGFYLLFCCAPLLTGNIVPDHRIGPNGIVSVKYKDKPAHSLVRSSIDTDPAIFRVLSLPSVGNYQVCLPSYNGMKYTGLDPILMNTSQSFIAGFHGLPHLYSMIGSEEYFKLLRVYSIKKIMVNQESVPWFQSIEKKTTAELDDFFSLHLKSHRLGHILLYDFEEDFLPTIYASS